LIQGLSVLAIIPARGGSRGVPGKNTLLVGGKPLIAWTIDAARASAHIDRLVLSSDDPGIIEVAHRWGCEAPFVRDGALATDEASSIDVVEDAIARLPAFDLVVLLQPTSPLRTAEDIDSTVQRLVDCDAPACVTLRPAEEHPFWTFGLDVGSRLVRYAGPPPHIPLRRQDLPAAWCLNGAVYAARTQWFLEQRTFLSPQTVGHPMPAERSLDIDTPADVELLRAIVERNRHTPTPPEVRR
jgi:CMP-N,N'-diacetyllegionaminic acid synthase